jgi:hypothetical protein
MEILCVPPSQWKEEREGGERQEAQWSWRDQTRRREENRTERGRKDEKEGKRRLDARTRTRTAEA